jgi:hypothetical protein
MPLKESCWNCGLSVNLLFENRTITLSGYDEMIPDDLYKNLLTVRFFLFILINKVFKIYFIRT